MAAYLDKSGLSEAWAKIKNYLNNALAEKKSKQSAVSDPSASGTSVTFISGISQNENGVISPSKKTVSTMGAASSSAAGTAGLVPAPASGKQNQFLRGDATWQTPTDTDTKNTAGATDSSSKLFLIGAPSQAANPQTYSQDTAYVGTDGCLYSGGTKVLTAHQDISGKKSTQTAVSDPTASGTGVEFISSISQNAQGVISPSKKTVRTMSGASATAAGSTGLVPAPAAGKQEQFLRGDGTWQVPTGTDTKNTAGSTDSSSKLFLIGATSQAANPQTYSHDTAYVGTDGCLYSGGKKVLTDHQDISGKVPTSRKINNKALSADITLNDEDIPSTAVTGQSTVEGALTSLGSQLSQQSAQIDNLKATDNALESGLAIVANGNTHAAITSGQYVYVKNHSTLAEGMYTASTAIATNETLTTSNLTALNAGGLNALNSKCTLKKAIETFTSSAYSWIYFPENRAIISAGLKNSESFIVTSVEGMKQITRGYYDANMTYHQFASNTQYEIAYLYYDRS